MSLIRPLIKRDYIPLFAYFLMFSVMTFPLIFHMGDSLPLNNADTHTALWQNWWVLESFQNNYDINHSPLLFYPNGLDVTLQPRRWTTLPIWIPLYSLFGDPLAFNLTALCQILFKAYGMYLFALWLMKNRFAAWVTGAFYAFAAMNLVPSLQQPNTGSTEWIPWFMFAFAYGLDRIRDSSGFKAGGNRKILLLMILAAIFFSANIYTNLKVGLFAMLLGGAYAGLIVLIDRLWSKSIFWLAMVLFAICSFVMSAPILMPSIQSPNLSSAIDDVLTKPLSIDVLEYIRPEIKAPINYTQLIASMEGKTLGGKGAVHVGIVSFAFALMGLLYAFRKDRRVFVWLILAIVFWALSLGTVIEIKGKPLDFYWTAYRLLENNIIFRILNHPSRMALLFIFPFSILIGYGLKYRIAHLSLNRKNYILLALTLIMLFYGTSIFPIVLRPVPRPDYVAVLDNQAGAVIDLPFGRQNAKYYMSVQRYHKHPIIEGMIARMPPDAYDYIENNSLLAVIYQHHNQESATPAELASINWVGDIQSLLDDGFDYLILHKTVPLSFTYDDRVDDWVFDLFGYLSPFYEDDEVRIYRLEDMLISPP